MLECVVNISEGRDLSVLAALSDACGSLLLDLHRDADHHRSVFTLGGPDDDVESAARKLVRAAVGALSLGTHMGAHPRFGVVDVVPFVALDANVGTAVDARDRFAQWLGGEMGIPCFLYGPLPGTRARDLPELRRHAFSTLPPDAGPPRPDERSGACAVGARGVMVAWNVWLTTVDVASARRIAAEIRGPSVRALAFALGAGVQVSCNLIDPGVVGPDQVYDQIRRLAASVGRGAGVSHAELVGLVPAAVLAAIPRTRWAELDLRPDATIEARLESGGDRSNLPSSP